MPRPKPTKEDISERKELAAKVKEFAKENKFTEIKLAEILELSRRTIQMIKAGKVSPHPATTKKLNGLFKKYRENKVA